VILQVADHPQPSKGVLEAAAAIAAWHSKARNGGLTLVSYTQAKNVRKPRGARPGTVTIQREGMLKVKPGLPAGATEEGENQWS
jgi:predicted ribosome quality control (RQC) complex YloA/Tae2 family protein